MIDWGDIETNRSEENQDKYVLFLKEQREKMKYYCQVNFYRYALSANCNFQCDLCHPVLVLDCYTASKDVIDKEWEIRENPKVEKQQ